MKKIDFRPSMRVSVNDNKVQEFCDIYNGMSDKAKMSVARTEFTLHQLNRTKNEQMLNYTIESPMECRIDSWRPYAYLEMNLQEYQLMQDVILTEYTDGIQIPHEISEDMRKKYSISARDSQELRVSAPNYFFNLDKMCGAGNNVINAL